MDISLQISTLNIWHKMTYKANVKLNGAGDPDRVSFPRFIPVRSYSVKVICPNCPDKSDCESGREKKDKYDLLLDWQLHTPNSWYWK